MAILERRVRVNNLEWFYREIEPTRATSDRLPVVFLHGLITQSYSWRDVMPKLAEQGFRAIAPDWIGHGFSGRPEQRDFSYTSDAFIDALEGFLAEISVERMHLVVQGFLGAYGLLYALQHSQQVERLVIVNAPLPPTTQLPWSFRRMGLPLVGEMMTQDPLLVDRALEGGGPYQVDALDLDVYRKPFLTTSAAGRALLATLRNFKLTDKTEEIANGLRQWQQTTLIVWGIADPWLPVELAETWAAELPNGNLSKLEQVGHYAQEDWAEKVAEVIVPFFRRVDVL